MAIQYTPFTIPLIVSTIILLAMVATAMGRRHVQSARTFIWLMLGIIAWTVFYALEISSAEANMQIFWAKLEYLGIASVPVLWLMFALEYTRRTNLFSLRNLSILWFVPVTTLVLALTNDYHHLIWTSFGAQTYNGALFVEYNHGPAFWVHTAYSYAMLALGSFLLIRQSTKGTSLYEAQSAVMILGATLPWLFNILYVFGLSPFFVLDLTPFALMLSGVFYAWGLFRLGLLDLIPVAGEVVLEGIQDGVMVLDATNRVVYVNPAFTTYSGIPSKSTIGWTADEILERWPDLAKEFGSTIEAQAQIAVRLDGENMRHFEMRISPLHDEHKRFIGRVFLLHETTFQEGVREVDLTSSASHNKLILVTTKANGEVIAVNDWFVSVFGYSRQEIIGKPSVNIWTSTEQRASLLRGSRQDGGIKDLETELLAKDGGMLKMLVSAKAINIKDEMYLFFVMREH